VSFVPVENPLGPTIAPFVASGLDPRDALRHLHASGVRFVQWSAALPGLRPRELDRSARRDLAVRLRRLELAPSGIDLWIPEAHLLDPAACDRAVAALRDAIDLAADLDRVPLSTSLPPGLPAEIIEAIGHHAGARGVAVANHDVSASYHEIGLGLDPARWLGRPDADPVARLTAEAGPPVAIRWSDADDAGRCEPGLGRLDLRAFRATLGVVAPGRPVALDLRAARDPAEAVRRCRDRWERAGAPPSGAA